MRLCGREIFEPTMKRGMHPTPEGAWLFIEQGVESAADERGMDGVGSSEGEARVLPVS